MIRHGLTHPWRTMGQLHRQQLYNDRNFKQLIGYTLLRPSYDKWLNHNAFSNRLPNFEDYFV